MSDLEETFANHCHVHGLPAPIRELPFSVSGRKWRFDFAWVDERIAVEIQGGTFKQGAHSTGKGLARDFEKHNAAIKEGWQLYYFDTNMVTSGEAINFMADVFAALRETA